MKIMQKIKVHGRACQHCDFDLILLISIFIEALKKIVGRFPKFGRQNFFET